jgi:hypothetical protein
MFITEGSSHYRLTWTSRHCIGMPKGRDLGRQLGFEPRTSGWGYTMDSPALSVALWRAPHQDRPVSHNLFRTPTPGVAGVGHSFCALLARHILWQTLPHAPRRKCPVQTLSLALHDRNAPRPKLPRVLQGRNIPVLECSGTDGQVLRPHFVGEAAHATVQPCGCPGNCRQLAGSQLAEGLCGRHLDTPSHHLSIPFAKSNRTRYRGVAVRAPAVLSLSLSLSLSHTHTHTHTHPHTDNAHR